MASFRHRLPASRWWEHCILDPLPFRVELSKNSASEYSLDVPHLVRGQVNLMARPLGARTRKVNVVGWDGGMPYPRWW